MSRLHKKRMKLLEDVKNGDISRRNLNEKDYSKTNIEYFKEERLIRGNLDSLQLRPAGAKLLAERNIAESSTNMSENTKNLQKIMDDFKESSSVQNEKMLNQSKIMNRLTWAVFIMTLFNVGLAIFQVIYR